MRRFALVISILAVLGGVGVAPAEQPAAAVDAILVSSGNTFVPPEVVVPQGSGLLHANVDAFEHNVTAVDVGPDGSALFEGDTISSGGTAQFDGVERLAPGSYDFVCTLHAPAMAGTLTVERTPEQGPRVALVPLPGIFQLPVAMAQHPDSDDLYIVEKTGHIRAVRGGLVLDPVPVLDISDEVSGGLEQGLLGLAFSPDGDFAYINFTGTDAHTRVVEFAFEDGALVPDSRREILLVEQPFSNHNAGTLKFGPDGYVYVSMGDGGSGGDPQYHGQRRETLLGNMLRIDPRPDGDEPYTIPADNPYVPDPDDPDKVIPDDARPQIWAYGLRNPWKFSFDRDTGDLWIADVGQNRWEEINVQRADSPGGENYGWNHMEGLELYDGRPEGAEEPEDHHPPIHVYPIFGEPSCAVTGGYVYGGEVDWLEGAYVFSDWCDGELRYIREQGGEVVEDASLGVIVPSMTSFGEDHDGELYAISLGGPVFRILPLP